MLSFEPTPLELSSKLNLFTLNSQELHSTVIVKHTAAIQDRLKRPASPLLEKLNQAEFWTALYLILEYDPKFNALSKIWEEIKPLAHLNSQELLDLYQKEVLPLERGYRYFALNQSDEVCEQINSNLEKLQRLKKHIYEGLINRAKAYQLLNTSSQVDDIVAYVAQGINQLTDSDSHLKVEHPLSQTLNNDRRLIIHDILEKADYPEEILQNTILKDVPIYGFKAIYSKEEVNNQLEEINDFCQRAVEKLNFGQFSEKIFNQSYKNIFNFLTKIPFGSILSKSFDYLQDKINWLKIKKRIEFIFNLKYLAYFAVSFFAYYALMEVLTPLLFLIVSAQILNTISSILFYTVAMAPFWAMSWNFLKQVKEGVHNYLICWKKQEVYDSLISLERNAHLVANKLSQVIVDVTHFDIEELKEDIQNCDTELRQAKVALARFAPGEKRLCQGTVLDVVKEVTAKIDLVEKNLQERQRVFANHIANRIGDEIEWIEKSIEREDYQPAFSKKQLEKLQNFVRTYGSAEDIAKFAEESDIVERWLAKIAKGKLAEKTQNTLTLNQPWGKYAIKMEILKKWDSLLNAFARNEQERAAVLELNALFQGKQHITKERLSQLVSKIRVDKEEAKLLMERLQEFLFHTLDPRASLNASLVSKEQREAIYHWYHVNESKIKDATAQFANILENDFDDEKLAEYFELLDGADIYSYASGENVDLDQRQNLARQFFEAYQGEKSLACRLIRFIPKTEQPSLTRRVASKRLEWIISQLAEGKTITPTKPFDKADVELFLEMALLENPAEFDFRTVIKNAVDKYQLSMRIVFPFLRTCLASGINTQPLIEQYQRAQRNGSSAILTQRNQSYVCAEETRVVSHENFSVGLRVIH